MDAARNSLALKLGTPSNQRRIVVIAYSCAQKNSQNISGVTSKLGVVFPPASKTITGRHRSIFRVAP